MTIYNFMVGAWSIFFIGPLILPLDLTANVIISSNLTLVGALIIDTFDLLYEVSLYPPP